MSEKMISGYRVSLEPMQDDMDPERGTWVACFVTSKGGGHSNSLELLSDMGEFDDGPKIPAADLDRIRDYAHANGWEG